MVGRYEFLTWRNKAAWKRLKKMKIKRKRRTIPKKVQSVVIKNEGGVIPLNRAPFPAQAIFRLRYCDEVSIAANGGAVGNYEWSCNGIYDPDVSGGGHQPLYRDTLAAQYNHYRVVASRFQLFCNSNAGENVAVNTIVSLRIDDDTSGPTTATDLMENPRCRWKLMHNCPKYNDLKDLNSPIVMKFVSKKFFGDGYREDSRSAAVGANPTDMAYWIVNYWTQPGVATNVTLLATVVIDYTVIFYEPKDIGGS